MNGKQLLCIGVLILGCVAGLSLWTSCQRLADHPKTTKTDSAAPVKPAEQKALTAEQGAKNSDILLSASYFDGKVKGGLQPKAGHNQTPTLTLVFYEKGTYRVAFSQIPGNNGRADLPRTFDIVVDAVPQTISRGALPELRVTITRNRISQFHDFR